MNIKFIKQPEEVTIALYPHQLTSVYEMEQREHHKQVSIDNKIINMNISIQSDKTGYGKCLGINTPVMLYNGHIKKVQDITCDDILMGDDSTPRTILSLARGKENMYIIKQHFGSDFIVNESHILSLKIKNKIKFQPDKIIIINNTSFIHHPTIFSETILFLYDNYQTKQECITAAEHLYHHLNNTILDITVIDFLNLPPSIKNKCRCYKVPIHCWENNIIYPSLTCYELGTMIGIYLLYGNTISKHKSIPDNYKYTTFQNRLQFLAGLLDTIGTLFNYHYTISNIYDDNLLTDLQFIILSCGLKYYVINHHISIFFLYL